MSIRDVLTGSGRTWSRFLTGATDLWATVVIVPAIVMVLGSEWTWERSARLPGLEAVGVADGAIPMAPRPEGASRGDSTILPPGSAIVATLPTLPSDFVVEIQADADDGYWVDGSVDGVRWEAGRALPPQPRAEGLRTRAVRFVTAGTGQTTFRFLRLTPRDGTAPYVVSDVRLAYRAAFDHRALIPIVWLGVLLVLLLRQFVLSPAAAARVGVVCRRIDPYLATALIGPVLFHVSNPAAVFTIAVGVTFGLVRATIWWSRGKPLAAAVVVAAFWTTLAVAVPWALETAVRGRVGDVYDLSVDHRLRPDGQEINPDGIRFLGVAEDLKDEAFVIAFLGDSFTFGLHLDYADSLPYAAEARLAEAACDATVRTVNFGWTSSSPLLGLRQLRDIGSRYRPDLVVYVLDVTDFHDDLAYARRLDERVFAIEPRSALGGLVAGWWPELRTGSFRSVVNLLRPFDRQRRADVPDDRYFVTSLPLTKTREAIERGVMANLTAIEALARESLGARMALVLVPRSYQYTDRESPLDPEAPLHEPLGPYVTEPFRYFEEAASRLPYPVLSLLPAFRDSATFPLYLVDDPHWNTAGSRLAAAEVATWLSGTGFVPCAATADRADQDMPMIVPSR